MVRESVILIIINNYDKFTTVEKTIADFFINNKVILDFSMKSIKEKLFITEASLTRFAKKCGFRGYREFIFAYEKEFIHIEKKLSKGISEVLNTYNIILNQIINVIDEQQIKRVADHITNSKNIYVVGIGSSGYAAKEMKSRFMRLGVLIDDVDKNDDIRMSSVFQNSQTMMLGISLSGHTESILYALKIAHQNGAKTVLITSNKEATYDFIDEMILIPVIKNLDYGHTISPQFPILIIIDIIYNYYLTNETHMMVRKEFHQKTLSAIGRKELQQ